MTQAPPEWYKSAVFYELSVRTFQDGNGDGKGDFPGLTSRLDYLKNLGVDCLWLLPWFPSPLRDMAKIARLSASSRKPKPETA